jgi:hypothetical protein
LLSCWAIWALFRKSLPMSIISSAFLSLSHTNFKISGLTLKSWPRKLILVQVE